MNTSFDLFGQLETPSIVLTNPNKEELYSLGGFAYNTRLTKRFNALSEFNFDFPSTIDNGETWVEAFQYIEAKRLVYISGEGYFIIDNVEETSDGQNPIKSVKSKSLEGEMLNKRFTSFKGTYKLFNLIPVSGVTTLMDKVLELLPTWSIGDVDSVSAGKYRTFDVNDSTVYGFLMNDCEKAFSCVFIFDTVLKKIHIKDVEGVVSPTDIYISYDNLIKDSSFTEISDEVATALYVSGNGNLRIASVNPLGGNLIYDFTYYKNTGWMSQNLVDKITAWELLISSRQEYYANLLTGYRVENQNLIDYNAQLAQLNTDYTAKESEVKIAIQRGNDISVLNSELVSIQSQITAKEAEIAAKEIDIAVIATLVGDVNLSLSLPVNFTEEELKQLSEFTYENSYQNNTLVVTSLTDQVEYQATAQELYNQAKSVLSRSSLPRYEFKINSVNFVALQEYSSFTSQLTLGDTVTVNVNDKFEIVPVLLEITLSYDDPTVFSMTFSNRLRLDNGNYQYSDLIGQVVSTGSAVAGNSQQWSDWDANYKDTVSGFITSALDASKNSVINAANQEITIGANGLRGRTTLSTEPGGYDPNQVWLTSNLLVFTKDNWYTASLAIGKLDYNGSTVFGVVGDAIVGHLIAGNQLQITNTGSNFILDENGAVLNNASFTIQNTNTAIVLTPNDKVVNGITSKGISIQSKASGFWENVFYTDVQGNLVLKGGVTALFGSFGGWTINANGISDTHGNYINSNGNVKLGGMLLTPGSARFTGDLYANNLYGRVVGASNYIPASIDPVAISHLDASQITTGRMLADYIYGGVMTGPDGFEMSLGWFGSSYIKSNRGLDLGIGSSSSVQNSPAISLRNGYMYLGSTSITHPTYVHMDGITEFHKDIRVTNGGTGRNASIVVGTQTLKFARGILVEGATSWGDTGGSGDVPPPVPSTIVWDKSVLRGSDILPSARAYYPCKLKNASAGDSTYLAIPTHFTGDASSHIKVYGVNGVTRVATATVTTPISSTGLTYARFSSTTSQVSVTGFELALDAGGGPADPADPGGTSITLVDYGIFDAASMGGTYTATQVHPSLIKCEFSFANSINQPFQFIKPGINVDLAFPSTVYLTTFFNDGGSSPFGWNFGGTYEQYFDDGVNLNCGFHGGNANLNFFVSEPYFYYPSAYSITGKVYWSTAPVDASPERVVGISSSSIFNKG